MKKTVLSLAVGLLMAPAFAETSEVESEDSGFLTSALNSAVESSMAAPAGASTSSDKQMEYGRTVTDFVSAPKFGGYYIGRYQYSDKDKAKGGAGFNQRLIRFYVDGTILKDFKYRIQIQTNNDKFHMKDVFLEWQRYKFAMVKIGQFKRAFGFENPMNPWDISTGDYSLFTKKMTGDYQGDSWSGGGRDQGIQVQGDFLPVGNDNHNLIHYQVGIWNGEGINKNNVDGHFDYIGTIQFQPIKNLYVGLFGWTGKYGTGASVENRDKYAIGVKYENKGWSLRGEYGHAQYSARPKFPTLDTDKKYTEEELMAYNAQVVAEWARAKAATKEDAWYLVAGMPINSWFRLCAQYQTYRPATSWSKAQCVYSLIPEFQLHKNLKFQIQYNYNDVRGHAAPNKDRHFNEIWAETYFRF